MIYLDSETCGLHGMMVLLQWAQDDGPVNLHDVWLSPVGDTIALLSEIARDDVCGFNIAFDWFHIVKLFTIWSELPPDWIPADHIDEIAIIEERARYSNWCIKPKRAHDVMLHSRKGPYQSLMSRKPVVIKRVPTQLAAKVALELEQRVEIDGIFFASRKDDRLPKWAVQETNDPAFRNVVLKFHPKGGLKTLAKYVLKYDDTIEYHQVDVAEHWRPNEVPRGMETKSSKGTKRRSKGGYAPFALAVGKPGDWNRAWPQVIEQHIAHWGFNQLARKYGTNDVIYTRDLYKHFDSPEPGDDDSELAICVACCRWKGYAVDLERLKALRADAIKSMQDIPQAPRAVKAWLFEVMDDEERATLDAGTKKEVLEEIAGKQEDDGSWKGGWEDDEGEVHPAAVRSRLTLSARRAKKEIELYDKLLIAKRFHASLKVIGAKSSRMSGADDLNPQGIKKTKVVRLCFPLADEGEDLSAGDFDSFEIALGCAVYDDPVLNDDLNQGKSIHGLFGQELFPDESYASIMASKKTSRDLYDISKRGVYQKMYGGTAPGMAFKLGITLEQAERGDQRFETRYLGVGREKKRIEEDFGALYQPIEGKHIHWREPKEYAETPLGFRRYFTLEIAICRALYELAQAAPAEWDAIKTKVRRRRDKLQTPGGASRSAIYGAAFNIVSSMKRAAANHRIQGYGAQITKALQRGIWDFQPPGVNEYVVRPLNIHDEVLCPTRPADVERVKAFVEAKVLSYKPQVPHIAMQWKTGMKTWADK